MKFPDYNTVYASLKTRQIDAWVAPSQQASGTVQPGDPAVIIENTFSLDNFVACAVAKEQRIGMVFQHFNLFPHRSVLDNVTLAPRKLKRLGGRSRPANSA